MSDDFKSEAEGYAASLRQQAKWISEWPMYDGADLEELDAAASFIERQQAEIESIKIENWRILTLIGNELRYINSESRVNLWPGEHRP